LLLKSLEKEENDREEKDRTHCFDTMIGVKKSVWKILCIFIDTQVILYTSCCTKNKIKDKNIDKHLNCTLVIISWIIL